MGSSMKDTIQQILKIVKDELKKEIHQILRILEEEQILNSNRYNELKSGIEDLKIGTKEQLDHVFESLSQDITFLSGDHHRLKRKVEFIEKRVKRLEDRA